MTKFITVHAIAFNHVDIQEYRVNVDKILCITKAASEKLRNEPRSVIVLHQDNELNCIETMGEIEELILHTMSVRT